MAFENHSAVSCSCRNSANLAVSCPDHTAECKASRDTGVSRAGERCSYILYARIKQRIGALVMKISHQVGLLSHVPVDTAGEQRDKMTYSIVPPILHVLYFLSNMHLHEVLEAPPEVHFDQPIQFVECNHCLW